VHLPLHLALLSFYRIGTSTTAIFSEDLASSNAEFGFFLLAFSLTVFLDAKEHRIKIEA